MLLSFERPTVGSPPAGALLSDLENCTVIQQTGITDARGDQLATFRGEQVQLGLKRGTPPIVPRIQLLKRIPGGSAEVIE